MSSLLNCLILFGRYPEPGRVKTRLIPYLGAAGAAQLQKYLTEKVTQTARAISYLSDIYFFYEGGSKKYFKKWLGKDIFYARQSGQHLGERMKNAIISVRNKGYKRAVLIGTDILNVTPEHIKKAFYELEKRELVIGPSDDGGYWLIGMDLRKPFLEVFDGIEWGTEKVLSQSVDIIKRANKSFQFLETLTDIDTIQDIKKTRLKMPIPYVSVIIPALNEEEYIRDAICSAKCRDAEVIVIDGGSEDKTRQIARSEGVRVIMSERGRVIQQNTAAEIAEGYVLLFLHADTVLPKGYVKDVFATLMDPSCLAGAFRFKTDMKGIFMRIIELVANLRAKYLGLPYGDQAIFMKKEFFQKIGGFPLIPVAEDLYLMHRISRMGKVRLVSKDALTSSRKWKRYGIIQVTSFHWKVFLSMFFERLKNEGWL